MSNEKQIDELAREVRHYIRTGSKDVRLEQMLLEFMFDVTSPDKKTKESLRECGYFLQALRREVEHPEVLPGKSKGIERIA